MSYITFIIPSLARPSLFRTLGSLFDQTEEDWEALIVFDGCTPITTTEGRIFSFKTDVKVGSPGLLRNLVIPMIHSEWIGFVDDDDWLSNTYIEKLKKYSAEDPELSAVIFTYRDVENGNTQPPLWMKEIVSCNVGISFAVKTKFIQEHNILFQKEGVEDFDFLDKVRKAGGKYVIPGDIQYWVGHRSAWGER